MEMNTASCMTPTHISFTKLNHKRKPPNEANRTQEIQILLPLTNSQITRSDEVESGSPMRNFVTLSQYVLDDFLILCKCDISDYLRTVTLE